MSLTAADVAEIMRLLEQSSFDSLDLEMNGVKLSLRRGGGEAGTATRVVTPSAKPSAISDAAPAAAAIPASAASTAPADPNVHNVPSPLLGTFYRSPKPGAPPFVEIGAAVTEDTTVAIIEVMKLMNTVSAGIRGTVTEILPSDGTLVEYDQTLLRIRKSS